MQSIGGLGREQPLAALLRTLAASVDGNPGEAILRGFLSPMPGRCVLFHVAHGSAITLLAHAGIEASIVRQHQSMPLVAHTPMTDALRAGTDLYLEGQQASKAYPLTASLTRALNTSRSFFLVRLVRRAGVPIGTLTIGFATPIPDLAEWNDRLEALTDVLALWSFSHRDATPLPSMDDSESVTARQREILALVSEGKTNPQIAAALGISVPTVKAELTWLFKLLGAKRRSQLPGRAIRAGV